MRRSIPFAPIGGAVAVALAVAVLLSTARGVATDPATLAWVTVVAGLVGGGLALAGGRRLEVLAVADGFLALAMLATLNGSGLPFVVTLLAVVAGTLASPARTPGEAASPAASVSFLTPGRHAAPSGPGNSRRPAAPGIAFAAGPAGRGGRHQRRPETVPVVQADQAETAPIRRTA